MNDSSGKMTRGAFVQGVVVLPALAALVAGTATPARAAKGSQAQYKYQTKPKDGKKCSGCTFFIPGKSATANGSCKIVEGTISPNGWCIAYSAKTS